jgi:hypothetical protein
MAFLTINGGTQANKAVYDNATINPPNAAGGP